MRSILALSLLVTLVIPLGASANAETANAETVRHAHHRHAAVAPDQGAVRDPNASYGYVPAGPPVQYEPAPVYSDQPDPRTDWVFRNWGG